jgi:hypothetical protein
MSSTLQTIESKAVSLGELFTQYLACAEVSKFLFRSRKGRGWLDRAVSGGVSLGRPPHASLLSTGGPASTSRPAGRPNIHAS